MLSRAGRFNIATKIADDFLDLVAPNARIACFAGGLALSEKLAWVKVERKRLTVITHPDFKLGAHRVIKIVVKALGNP